MQTVKAFLRLIRWPNLMMLGLIQYIVYIRLLDPDSTLLSPFALTTLIFITILIGASGYVINDFYDAKIDQHNRPDTWVAGNTISLIYVLVLYWELVVFGAFLAIWFAVNLDMVRYLFIYPLAVAGLWAYSFSFKCRPVIGNLWVSLFCAGVVLVVGAVDWLYANNTAINPGIWYFAAFAFLSTWLREVVKDLEDAEGDRKETCQTFVVHYGLKAGKTMAVVLGIALMIAIYLWESTYTAKDYKFIFTIIQGFMVAVVGFIFMASSRTYFHYASLVIKAIMIAGTLLLFLNI